MLKGEAMNVNQANVDERAYRRSNGDVVVGDFSIHPYLHIIWVEYGQLPTNHLQESANHTRYIYPVVVS